MIIIDERKKKMKIITTLIGIAILVVLVICAMNMLGLGDVVSGAGEAIRQKSGIVRKGKPQSTVGTADDFAKQALGWDIREVNKKPVATVKQGRPSLKLE